MIALTIQLFAGCVEPADSWEQQKLECDVTEAPALCFRLASDPRATVVERSLFFGRACKGGIDEGCVGQLRGIAERDAKLGAIAVLGFCEDQGKYCRLAVELTADARLPEDKRAEYSKRARLALEKANAK